MDGMFNACVLMQIVRHGELLAQSRCHSHILQRRLWTLWTLWTRITADILTVHLPNAMGGCNYVHPRTTRARHWSERTVPRQMIQWRKLVKPAPELDSEGQGNCRCNARSHVHDTAFASLAVTVKPMGDLTAAAVAKSQYAWQPRWSLRCWQFSSHSQYVVDQFAVLAIVIPWYA